MNMKIPSCSVAPKDKKAYTKKVGEILVEKYGKKKFYTPAQVKYASNKSGYGFDFHCWAMCIYTSPNDFDSYHQKVGEVCDYKGMRAEMASGNDGVGADSWFDFDLSWFDWPDLSSIFDVFD